MDILKLATEILSKTLGEGVSVEAISSALSGLLGDGKGGIDIPGLIGKMNKEEGLANLAKSWLGSGDNGAINPTEIMGLFGADKLSGFAQALNIGQDQAASGLADMLPKLIDQSSSGDLLSSVGGLSGAASMVKGFFNK